MGDLWEWIGALAEEDRVQAIFFHLQLGIKVASHLGNAAAAIMAGVQMPASDARMPRTPRASRAGLSYEARLNFSDGMGELWAWVRGVPGGKRVHDIFFHLRLGIMVAPRLTHAADTVALGAHKSPPLQAVALPEASVAPSAPSLALDDDWDPIAMMGDQRS